MIRDTTFEEECGLQYCLLAFPSIYKTEDDDDNYEDYYDDNECDDDNDSEYDDDDDLNLPES